MFLLKMNEIHSKATNVVVLYFVIISVAWDIFGSTKSIPSQSEMFAESAHRKGPVVGECNCWLVLSIPLKNLIENYYPKYWLENIKQTFWRYFCTVSNIFKICQPSPSFVKKPGSAPALWAHQAHSPRPDRCWANVFWILLDERSTRQLAGRRIHKGRERGVNMCKPRWMLPCILMLMIFDDNDFWEMPYEIGNLRKHEALCSPVCRCSLFSTKPSNL